jgi:hypothetical protein
MASSAVGSLGGRTVGRAVWVFALGAAMMLASCSGTEAPPPRPTDASPTSVAPVVDEPVNLRPHRTHPCALLSRQELARLEFPRQQQFERPTNGDCEWFRDESKPGWLETYTYTLTVHATGDPLANAYRDAAGERRWTRFEPRTVRGLPAVERAPADPGKFCEVVVGAGQGQGLTISGLVTTGFEDATMCRRLLAAAELVIDKARR